MLSVVTTCSVSNGSVSSSTPGGNHQRFAAIYPIESAVVRAQSEGINRILVFFSFAAQIAHDSSFYKPDELCTQYETKKNLFYGLICSALFDLLSSICSGRSEIFLPPNTHTLEHIIHSHIHRLKTEISFC